MVNDGSIGIKVCSSNDEIVHLVSQTHGAVGYAGAGLLYEKHGKPNDTNWTMQIYINHQRAISPYESAKVKRGEYILTRPLNQYI